MGHYAGVFVKLSSLGVICADPGIFHKEGGGGGVQTCLKVENVLSR